MVGAVRAVAFGALAAARAAAARAAARAAASGCAAREGCRWWLRPRS